MKNYYEILGVSFDATQAEVKKAYWEMVKKYHPDKHPETETNYYEAKTKELNEAYEVLGNETKRREYNIKYAMYEEAQARKQEQARRNQERQKTQNTSSRRTTNNTEQFNESSTNRTRSRSHYKQNTSGNSFFESIKKSCKEVKADESKYPFKERHRNLNKKFKRNFWKKDMSTAGEFAFRVGQGVVHISAETLYQLSKLSYINKDNLIKYVYRNRILATTVIIGIIIASNLPGQSTDKVVTQGPIEPTTISADQLAGKEVKNQEIDEQENSTTLMRYYTVSYGDSFSSLSDMSLTKIDDIKNINGYVTDTLYLGDEIKLPYVVSKDDLQYYTKAIYTNGMSLKDLANLYETDENTLYKLNKEAIEISDGAYIIKTDNILVPNFISSNELQERKGKVKTY